MSKHPLSLSISIFFTALVTLSIIFSIFPVVSKADVPIGTILPFYGKMEQRPTGYLFCDGAEFYRDNYPDLFDHLTRANPALRIDDNRANLPDLRGEFLRGVDLGRGVDTDRKSPPGHPLGSAQASQAAVAKHDHRLSQKHSISWGWSGGWGDAGNTRAVNHWEPATADTDPHMTRPRPGASHGDEYMTVIPYESDPSVETRPRNIAVNFIIRAW